METSCETDLKHILEMETKIEDDLMDTRLEGMYMDDDIGWWPLEDVRKGDLKELQGLFDKGILKMATSNLNKGGDKARFISSKVVRRSKNQGCEVKDVFE